MVLSTGTNKIKTAVFISGKGSNLISLIKFSKLQKSPISINLIISNNKLAEGLKYGDIFGSEQLAMNMSVYIDNVETEFLPLNCNWITSNLLPKFDEENNTFVEPYLPNYKIGIIHLAAGIWKDGKDMRTNKDIKIQIKTLNDKTVLKSLRYNIN